MNDDMNAVKPAYLNPDLPVDQRIADLLSRMTLQEKVHQLQSQMLIRPEDGERRPEVGHVRNPAHFVHSGNNRKTPSECAEIINNDQRRAIESSRWGIPVLENGESLHGAQWGDATCFPQAIALTSSWNADLMAKVARAIAKELRAVGVRHVFAPVVNIARDPRWGRTQETYGEDPYLTSRMAVAYVRALEGENIIATPKHFAANFADGGRDSNAVNLSWRILREIYFPAFRACVQEGGARSIMPAYNSLDGVPCSCNAKLLTDILRNEWGFQGYIVSDYGAVNGITVAHHCAEDYADAARKAIEAGLDVELPNGGGELLNLVKNGRLSQEVIDRSVARVLKAKFELGLFEEPYVDPRHADEIVRCQEHVELALHAAREGIVLLKNQGNVLPLDKKIGVLGIFGPTKDIVNLGDYSGPFGGWHGPGVTPLQGIQNVVSKTTKVLVHNDDEDPAELTKHCDVALIFTAISETEGGDRSNIDLPHDQERVIKAVAKTGVPTVVVLVNGSAVTMQNWINDVAAVVEAWYPGEQGGTAIAEVLFSDYNPAGRLPITFPKTVGQLPLYYNYKPSGRGYGYNDNDGEPLFPFGHGLSYTEFRYDTLRINPETIMSGGSVNISLDVQNIGNRRGDEIVQLYMHDEVSSVATPLKQLKGFRRISLKPDEKTNVTFTLSHNDLALWNRDMEFVVEPGSFKVMIGSSSKDIRLEDHFEVLEDKEIERNGDDQ